jgi:hypothetical protein
LDSLVIGVFFGVDFLATIRLIDFQLLQVLPQEFMHRSSQRRAPLCDP